MFKRVTKKLILSKETLRELTTGEIRHVVAADDLESAHGPRCLVASSETCPPRV